MSFSVTEYNELSTWRIHDINIDGGECFELDLNDTRPNQFIIQNPNDERLLIGISKMPTENNYEYDIAKNITKPIGRPIRTNKLYILNTGSVAVNVKVFSVFKEFDIASVNNSSVHIDNAEIKTDGIVNGFKTGVELPSGDNHIGGVNIDNFASLLESLTTILNVVLDEQNGINRNFLLDNVAEKLININSYLGGMNSNINLLENYMFDLLRSLTSSKNTPVYKNNVVDFHFTASNNCTIHFDYLTNDGGAVATIYVNGVDKFTLLEYEKVFDLEIDVNKDDVVTIESSSPMYRIKYYTYSKRK